MSPASSPSEGQPRQRLRILQTTDLHMHLLPFDYDLMVPATDRSFAHLRRMITDLRSDGVPTLLCDTGDFLQGTAMADIAATAPGTHPMIAAFNDLQYDAVVLGNHDFDYGVAPLQKALRDLTCPVLAANLAFDDDDLPVAPFAIIPVPTPEGSIQVGLLGLTVPPSPHVNQADGKTRIDTLPPRDVAIAAIDQMTAVGADVIVALCHFGIDPQDTVENIAADIAALPGIDAVLAGHTHDVFPDPKFAKTDVIDPVQGTLHGTPTVMSGAFGRHLGVIDLDMTQRSGGWTVTASTSRVMQPTASPVPPPLPTPGVLALHEATLARLRTQVATTHVPLSNQFSMIAPDMSQQILAEARMRKIADALKGTAEADLPLLASAAPYRAGNKDAPAVFLDVPPGPVILNDVIGIFPFQDRIIGLRRTGAQLKSWLENAAQRFAQVTIGKTDQPLLNPRIAPYDLSTIFGLTYQIDLSRPVGSRISDLRFEGRVLHESDRFIVATTPYRHRSDKAATQHDVVTLTNETSQEVLLNDLATLGTIDQVPTPVWRFAPLVDTAATFETAATTPPDAFTYQVALVETLANGLNRFSIQFS